MPVTKYTFSKDIEADRLKALIEASSISTPLEYITEVFDGEVHSAS